MRYTKLKGIDKNWSVITFGCWQIAPSAGWGDNCTPKEADAVVKATLESGITAFDTAEGYGDGESEKRLGKALGKKKDDVIIISKIWPDAELTLKAYQKRLDNSLRALGRDYVDVYLIHWPVDDFGTPKSSAKLTDIMYSLKNSGKTTTIGLSNFKLLDLSLFKDKLSNFSINQIPYNLLEREYEGKTTQICQKHGLKYMAYSPTARGLLAKRMKEQDLLYSTRKKNELYNPPLYQEALKVFAVVEAIAKELKCQPIHVSLAWVLAQDNILTAIVGSRKTKQPKEFAAAANLKLTKDHLTRLNKASDRFILFKNSCEASL